MDMKESLVEVGTRVWVYVDKKGWRKSSVLQKIDEHTILIVTKREEEEYEVKIKDVELDTTDKGMVVNVEDLTMLPDLHEPGELTLTAIYVNQLNSSPVHIGGTYRCGQNVHVHRAHSTSHQSL